MNLIDNGIEEVLNIEKVIKDDEMYFEVEFIDWYGRTEKKKFSSIKDLEKKSWVE